MSILDNPDKESSLAFMADQLTVKFIEVPARYKRSEDIICRYTSETYKIRDGDRVAIFRMGWKSLKHYVLFEWASDSSPSPVHTVIFSKFDLPKSDQDELYQFCYINNENIVQGISEPFQYSSDTKPTLNLTDSLKNENQCAQLKHMLSLRDQEIQKLKEENAMLKESLKALVQQRSPGVKNYDEDIAELKDLTTKLKSIVLSQQKEIDCLKLEIKRDRAEYKSFMLEKLIGEKKCERKESGVRRLSNLDYDLGSLQPLPPFPFDSPDES